MRGFRIRIKLRARKLEHYLSNLLKLSWSERRDELLEVWDFQKRKFRHKLWRSYYKLGLATGAQFGHRFREFFKVGYVAIRNYLPKPYSGRVLLIWSASELEQDVQDCEMSWSGLLLGGTEVQYVAAGHRGMFLEPSVGILANILRNSLSQARELNEGFSSKSSDRSG